MESPPDIHVEEADGVTTYRFYYATQYRHEGQGYLRRVDWWFWVIVAALPLLIFAAGLERGAVMWVGLCGVVILPMMAGAILRAMGLSGLGLMKMQISVDDKQLVLNWPMSLSCRTIALTDITKIDGENGGAIDVILKDGERVEVPAGGTVASSRIWLANELQESIDGNQYPAIMRRTAASRVVIDDGIR